MQKRRGTCHGNRESCQLWQQTLTSTRLPLVMVIASGRASCGVDAGFISPTAQRGVRPPGVCHREQHDPRRRRSVRSDAAAASPPPDPAGRRWEHVGQQRAGLAAWWGDGHRIASRSNGWVRSPNRPSSPTWTCSPTAARSSFIPFSARAQSMGLGVEDSGGRTFLPSSHLRCSVFRAKRL